MKRTEQSLRWVLLDEYDMMSGQSLPCYVIVCFSTLSPLVQVGLHESCLSAVRSLPEEGAGDSSIAYLERLRAETDCMLKPILQGLSILDLFMTHLLQTSSMKDHVSRLIITGRSSR